MKRVGVRGMHGTMLTLTIIGFLVPVVSVAIVWYVASTKKLRQVVGVPPVGGL